MNSFHSHSFSLIYLHYSCFFLKKFIHLFRIVFGIVAKIVHGKLDDNQARLVIPTLPIPNPTQMVEKGSNNEENEENEMPHIRTLRNYPQAPMASASSCIVIPYNAQPFQSIVAMIQLPHS